MKVWLRSEDFPFAKTKTMVIFRWFPAVSFPRVQPSKISDERPKASALAWNALTDAASSAAATWAEERLKNRFTLGCPRKLGSRGSFNGL